MKLLKVTLICLLVCLSASPTQKKRSSRPGRMQQATQPVKPPPPVPLPQEPEIIRPPEKKLSIEEISNLRAVMETSLGNIVLDFYPEAAPEHVRQFVWLSQVGYFDGMSFSRILPKLLIQSGNYASWQEDNPNLKKRFDIPKLKAEYSPAARHDRGALSMARPNDDPDGGTCHFFICATRIPALDDKYTVFGYVSEGIEVVEKIAEQPVDGDKPLNRIEIKRVSIVQKASNDPSNR
ncbi:MAG: peptidylprolyl isomerase [Acidobacteriota bacterium]|nr:peptidylprolyl isomerase [Blastocatellia bacterium]MDW8412422.1 peptidylprolyl isomerase [Acidobacteriota bacterium]